MNSKYNINFIFHYSFVLILFFGVNVLYTLGFKNPNVISSALIDNINWGIIPIILGTLILILIGKLKDFRNELFFFIYIILFIITNLLLLNRSASITFIINAFLGPVFIGLLLRNFTGYKSRLYKLIIIYFLAEVSICIVERVLMYNFFTTSIEVENTAEIVRSEFRSLSIHGHPLQGALIISIIMSFIYISNIKYLKKLLFLALGFSTLLAFNTRSSIAFWGVLLGWLILKNICTNKLSSKEKLLSFTFICIGICGLIYLINQGWGGRLIEMSLFDESSASVRIDLFYMFNFLSWQDILWGIPLENIEYIKYKSGIGIIENYWVIYIFSYGLVATIIFVLFTATCLKSLFKNYTIFQKCITIGTFLVISSTNNSMATNSPAMFILVMCAYAFPIYNKKIKRNDSQKDSLLLVRKKATTKTSTQMY